MRDTMSNVGSHQLPAFEPASVLDIITYGYRGIFKSIWPLTQLVLPILIPYAITSTAYFVLAAGIEGSSMGLGTSLALLAAMGGMMLFGALFVYSYYVLFRYIRDLYWGEVHDNIWWYYIPRKSLLGCLGLAFLNALAFVPAMIAVGIASIFLIIPGIILFSWYSTVVSMAFMLYMANPEETVIDNMMASITSAVKYATGSFFRTAAIGFLAWLIFIVISSPMAFFNGLLNFLQGFAPSVAKSFWYWLIYGGTLMVVQWFTVVVGFGGPVFVIYRYLFDLKLRMEPPPSANMADYRGTPPSTNYQG